MRDGISKEAKGLNGRYVDETGFRFLPSEPLVCAKIPQRDVEASNSQRLHYDFSVV